MFNMMRIRAKLAVTLAIPLLALVGLSSFVVVLSAQQADDATRRADAIAEQVALATSALGPTGVIGALETERSSEVLVLVSANLSSMEGIGILAEPARARAETDAAVTQFHKTVAASPPSVQAIFGPAVTEVDKITAIRQFSDTSDSPRKIPNPTAQKTYADYSQII